MKTNSVINETVNLGKYLLIEHLQPSRADKELFGSRRKHLMTLFFLAHYWTFTVRILWRFNNNLFGKELRFCRRAMSLSSKKEFNAREEFFSGGSSSWIKWHRGEGREKKNIKVDLSWSENLKDRRRLTWKVDGRNKFQLCQIANQFYQQTLPLVIFDRAEKKVTVKRRKQPREKRDKNFIYKQLAQKKNIEKRKQQKRTSAERIWIAVGVQFLV